MLKRSNANHCLWPKQARPWRGMSLAAGGFAVGIITAIAVMNSASQYVAPMAMEPEPIQNAEAVRPIPVYSGSSTLAADTPPPASEEPSRTYRRRGTGAKVALPIIGRAVPLASETDGRGDDATVNLAPVQLTDDSGVPATTALPNSKLIGDDSEAAREEKPSLPEQSPAQLATREPAPEAAAEPQEPAPAVQPTRNTRPKPRARSRLRAKQQAERSRPQRDELRPTYAARYRAGPVYGANGAPIAGTFPY
jgi:nicotinate-nucleotide--dimethylbenzimidazole phosphoribosyltransferase